MEAGFDFNAWLQSSVLLAAGLLPFNMSIVNAAEKFGAAGKVQAGIGVITGLVLGIGCQVAVYGVPVDFAGWFRAGLFGLMVAGGSIGTYEVLVKANESAAARLNGS